MLHRHRALTSALFHATGNGEQRWIQNGDNGIGPDAPTLGNQGRTYTFYRTCAACRWRIAPIGAISGVSRPEPRESITRGAGKSAVAAAAYRAGETIKNEYDGIVHDYTRKGGIVHTEILLPENAPAKYSDRAVLWNALEKSERYCNAQLSREIEIALPVELSREQNISLARRFIKEQFVAAGMCADVCVHDVGEGNPHAHIMLTMRPIEKSGAWGAKSKTVNGRKINTVNWNDHDRAEDWRKAWAAYCNTALRINEHDTVLDHRSYERQGVEQVPPVNNLCRYLSYQLACSRYIRAYLPSCAINCSCIPNSHICPSSISKIRSAILVEPSRCVTKIAVLP